MDNYDFESLSHRVEFRNLWNKEGLFNYQEYARRYMAPHTPNKSLLLFHSLGSGKTLTCISISVDHYEANKSKSIIITKSMHGHYIFRTEIEKYKKMHGDFNDKEIFSMNSYIEFHNRLREMTDTEIREKYSQTIIIMDEIHNIKYQKVNFDSVYQQLIRLITLSDNTRLILSTATPMTDNVEQVESILNLFAINSAQVSISYNAITQNVANTIFHGEIIYEYFYPVVEIPMSRHQTHMYMNLYNEKVNNDVYRSLSQVSLFCSIDGYYGRRIMSHMMQSEKITKRVVTDRHKEISYMVYRIREEYVPDITDFLDLTSCKYSYFLKSLSIDNGTFFVFIEDVLGSGIIILMEILRHHGYETYIGDDITRLKPAPRYTFCVGTADLCPNMEDRIEGFNHPLNKDGKYIKLMIGSRVLGESITLKNVRNFHCMIPHWNDSVVIQALGRVLRSKSHEDLDEKDRYVNVHIYCSTLPDTESIDRKKIRISNTKQSKISKMIDTLKENSIEKYTIHNPRDHSWYYVDYFIKYYLERYIPMLIQYLEHLFKYKNSFEINEIEEWINIDRKITRQLLIKCIVDNIPINGSLLRTFRNNVFIIPYDESRAYITANYPSNVVDKRLIPLPTSSIIPSNLPDKIPSLKYIRQHLTAADLEYMIEHTNIEDIPDYMKNVLITLDDGSIVHTLCYTKNYDVSYKASIPIPSIPSGLRIKMEEWTTCTPEMERSLLPQLRYLFTELFDKIDSYPIYGIISTIDMNMRLSTKITELDNKQDRRMKHRGRMLSTLTKNNLYILGQILSDDDIYNKLCKEYQEGKRYKELNEIYPYKDWVDETNSTLIQNIETLIIQRNIYMLI